MGLMENILFEVLFNGLLLLVSRSPGGGYAHLELGAPIKKGYI
jgi:hypothetical protein